MNSSRGTHEETKDTAQLSLARTASLSPVFLPNSLGMNVSITLPLLPTATASSDFPLQALTASRSSKGHTQCSAIGQMQVLLCRDATKRVLIQQTMMHIVFLNSKSKVYLGKQLHEPA